MSIIVTIMALTLCIVSIIMSNHRFSATNEDLFKQEALDLTRVVSLTVDGDALKTVKDRVHDIFASIPPDKVVISDEWGSDDFNKQIELFAPVVDMPEYKKVHEQLSKVQNLDIPTVSSVYTMIYDENEKMEYSLYLVDAATEDPCLPGVFDHVDSFDWDDVDVMNREGKDPYLTNTEMYGWLVTAVVPIYTTDGEIAGLASIDLDMNEIKANESSFFMMLALTLIAITLISVIITLVIISKTIVRPVKQLSVAAGDYISNDENSIKFSSIYIHNSDEIGDLSNAMKKMESDINDYIDNITLITAEKERVGAELNIASKMQTDMLPKNFPERRDIDIFATMTPAKEMGGDFYDFFMIDDDHMALVMADVSGKGIPAAMFMIIAKTLIKIRTTAPGTPAQALWDINNKLCEDNPSGLFVTAWFGILTLSSGKLICSNAGHEYPALMHKYGNYELLENDNMPPLAAMEDLEYEDEEIQLLPGDRLFLYTDGVPEAKAPDGSRFGTDKMIEILNSKKDCTPEELLTEMKKKVDEFTGDSDPFDDVTMMSVIWHGKS